MAGAVMPQHRQPASLLSLCHAQVAVDLVATCRLLQLVAQDSSAVHALSLARRKFRPLYFGSLPGSVRSQLIAEVSRMLSAPGPDGTTTGAGPAPLYLLAMLLGKDVRRLRLELCCYYGCSHQVALLRLLASEGGGLEVLELARSALLRLDRALLHDALTSTSSLRHLVLRNIAGDAVLQVIGSACPHLVVLDVAHSRQVTDVGLRHLFLQVELRDKTVPQASRCGFSGIHHGAGPAVSCGGKGWGRLRILLKLFPWMKLNRDAAGKLKDRSFLLEYCERRNALCESLRVLNIANTGVTSAGVLLALHHVPQLKSLGEYGHMGRALEILDRAWTASDCPVPPRFHLTSARSQRTTTRRVELLALALPKLESLSIFEPHHPPSALLNFPPGLSTLHLINIPSQPDWVCGLYDYIATEQGSKLRELALRFYPGEAVVSVNLSQVVRSCPNLICLCMDGADVIWESCSDSSSRLLPKLNQLRSIQLGRTVCALALSEVLKRAPVLETAHFYSCPDVSDVHIVDLATGATPGRCSWLSPHLECFYIYEAPQIRVPAVVTLLATCERLGRTGNLANWGLDCEEVQTIHNTITENNLSLEISGGSHWFCSPCFPIS